MSLTKTITFPLLIYMKIKIHALEKLFTASLTAPILCAAGCNQTSFKATHARTLKQKKSRWVRMDSRAADAELFVADVCSTVLSNLRVAGIFFIVETSISHFCKKRERSHCNNNIFLLEGILVIINDKQNHHLHYQCVHSVCFHIDLTPLFTHILQTRTTKALLRQCFIRLPEVKWELCSILAEISWTEGNWHRL